VVVEVVVVEVMAVAVETTWSDVDVGRLDDEVWDRQECWLVSAEDEGPAGVLGAESELIVTIFIFDRSRWSGF
jgi:hypothetical protein